jgi:GNAT superfamily N-acetyltransferase
VIIRPAGESDIPAIAILATQVNVLHQEAWPAIFAPLTDTAQLAAYWKVRYVTAGTRILVAVADAEVVGMAAASLQEEKNNLMLQDRRCCCVDIIAVKDGYRRQGIGRGLMLALEAWSKEQGAQEIRFTVWQFNNGARIFYEELGYGVRSVTMARIL